MDRLGLNTWMMPFDRAVDRCYRPQPFATELARLEFLFGFYQLLSAPVLGATPKAKAKPRTTA